MHVLVILNDMTNYCETPRSVPPAGKCPAVVAIGYLLPDLATIYERAGRIKNRRAPSRWFPSHHAEDDKTRNCPT